MTKKLISFLIALCIFIAIPLSARYKYNPFTRKLDYYQTGADIDLGDLADVTLTGLATGNVLYYDGSAWVNLATEADTQFLTLAAGIPAWQAIPAGVTTFVGLNDTPNNYAGSNSYMVRVNAGAAALVFGAESAIDHDGLTNWAANKHIDHTAVSVLSGGLISGGGTIDGNQTLTLTEATIESNIDTLANLTSIQGQNVTFSGSLNVEANSNINQDVTSDGSPTFGGLTVTNVFSYDYTTDHNLLLGYLAGEDLTAGQGQYNTLLGEEAGADVTTGDYNIIIGYMTGRKITTNVSNILIGRNIASVSVSQAHSNVIIGDTAAIELTNGYENVILGKEAARDIKSAGLNVIIGWQASLEHESGNSNVVIGTQAGYGVAGSSNYAYNVFIGEQAGELALTAAVRNVVIGYQAAEDLSTGTDNIVIGYMAGEGWLDTESEKLVIDVTDTATPLIYGDFSADNITFNGDLSVLMDAATDQVLFLQEAEEGTEDQPLVWIDDAREGATVDEWLEASLRINSEDYGLAVNGKSHFEGDAIFVEDVFFTWASSNDRMVIAQSAVAGTEDQPLIFIDDDRTGATAASETEATIVIDAEGIYALSILDGNAWFADLTYFLGAMSIRANSNVQDSIVLSFGNGSDVGLQHITQGTGDDFFAIDIAGTANVTEAIWIADYLISQSWGNFTDLDDFLSPTLVIVNAEGADVKDYSAVMIGERGQANVKVAHYFDFYAMNGAIDGSATGDVLSAIFRFGASGSATPGYATTPGDVLFEGTIEVDGDKQVAGYNRQDYITWNDCFDHGSTVAKYGQDWDLTALNTQGTGSNTIQTTPSHITLTTDNNAAGDNEGTRTDYQIVNRARQVRTEFSVDLGQTANTQFYCGWNTSGTNAMVAAADEYVIVWFDISDEEDPNWQIKVGDGATEDVFTSLIAADTNTVLHEIWVETDGTVHWAVNGTELDITGSVDNLMTASDHYLIVGQVQSVTGAAAIVAEIDFVELEKIKVH